MPDNIDFRAHGSSEQVFLSYKTTGIQTTLIKLEMNADNLTFYSNVANGKIYLAEIVQDGFEAMSGSGFIEYMVMNTDTFDATFYIDLADCSDDILPAPSQQASISSREVYTSTFQVQTTKTDAYNYTCTVILKNSEGCEVDSKEVGFNTIAQQNYTVDQGESGADSKGTEAEQEYKDASGCSSCSGMFSLF